MIKIELIFFKVFFCASLQHKTSFLSESAFITLFEGRNSVILKAAISANFGCNLSPNVYASSLAQVKIHAKMAIFQLVFSTKNPVKSDKLALIYGKILNLVFFYINIPVVPIEIWLRVTHNQRQNTLKFASVLLFRHILKIKSWLECSSSLLNSRM